VTQRQDNRLERNLHLVSDFQDHVTLLREQGAVSLGELSLILSQPRVESHASVITFDDGYANNLLAADILARGRLPWAIFVSTGAVGRKRAIWTVELSLLLLHGTASQIDALGQVWSLDSRERREAAFQSIRHRLKPLPSHPRRETLDAIRAQFPTAETERLLEQFPVFQMLTWAELRQLADAGVEIGSHGVDHELHHATQDPEVRRRELVESRKENEQRLGKPFRTEIPVSTRRARLKRRVMNWLSPRSRASSSPTPTASCCRAFPPAVRSPNLNSN
jgi:peptidoglycan/xylan/chitin deacetylase (PgdA/CDA1 family)